MAALKRTSLMLCRTGRKPLFYVAGAIMFGMQIATGALAAVNFKNGSIPAQIANGMLTCICIFVACFSFSWGPLGWLVRGIPSLSYVTLLVD